MVEAETETRKNKATLRAEIVDLAGDAERLKNDGLEIQFKPFKVKWRKEQP